MDATICQVKVDEWPLIKKGTRETVKDLMNAATPAKKPGKGSMVTN